MRNLTLSVSAMALLILMGCQDTMVNPEAETSTAVHAQAVSKAEFGMIWADGELFRTRGTPTSFNPDNGNFDILYQGSFLDGIGAISEAKPGDQDYNGGRWAVYQLKDGVATDYSNANSAEDLNPDDFEPAGNYFECPLIPQRGKGHDQG